MFDAQAFVVLIMFKHLSKVNQLYVSQKENKDICLMYVNIQKYMNKIGNRHSLQLHSLFL